MNKKPPMREDWNKRAQENAYHWVVSQQSTWDKDEYYQEGEKDIARLVLPFFQKKGISEEQYKNFTVLDIGCGTGRLCRALSKICARVKGVDVAEEMIKRAREDNVDRKNIEFLLTSGTDFSVIESESIDFCFSYIVFQHIPSKEIIHEYLREVLRVLKSGGVAKIQIRGTPGNPPGKVVWFRGLASRYIALVLWRKFIPLLWIRKYDTVYGACYRPREIKNLLKSIGFTDVFAEYETPKYLWIEVKKP